MGQRDRRSVSSYVPRLPLRFFGATRLMIDGGGAPLADEIAL